MAFIWRHCNTHMVHAMCYFCGEIAVYATNIIQGHFTGTVQF